VRRPLRGHDLRPGLVTSGRVSRGTELCGLVSRNRVGESGSQTRAKSTSPPPQVTDVRQLLEEKRKGLAQHRGPPLVAPSGKSGLTV